MQRLNKKKVKNIYSGNKIWVVVMAKWEVLSQLCNVTSVLYFLHPNACRHYYQSWHREPKYLPCCKYREVVGKI